MVEFSILDVMDKELLMKFKETASGALNGPCPSCGYGNGMGSNSSGGVIYPQTNTFFCNNSGTIFNTEEFLALCEGTISCSEGRQKL